MSIKQLIHANEAPAAIGPYSQAIKVGETVYFSGQIALDPQTMQLVGDDFKSQAMQIFLNLQAVAKAAGGDLSQIVKLTIYLIDLANFDILNELMLQFFKPPYPARTTVQVSLLPKSAQIEVDAVMVVLLN